MEQKACALQEEQSLLDICKEFQEKIFEICNITPIGLELILNEQMICFESIQKLFDTIQDEKQLNQITSTCNEYQIIYQSKKKQIDMKALQQMTINSTEILENSTECLNLKKQTIENQYQQIQKEGVDKLSQMIEPTLESDNNQHIGPFVEYLIQNISNLNQKESKFQEILDNLDLTQRQLNQILQIWEVYRLKLKEKKDLIDQIQKEISQSQEKKMQNEFQGEEKKEENSIVFNSIKTLEKEIEELQKQIRQLTEEFQQYLTCYLQENCDVINLEDVNQLVEKLNLDAAEENESINIDQIIQTFDLTIKQEKQIKSEFQKFNQEIMKRKDIIKQKNAQIDFFNEQLKINQSTIQIDPKQNLINNFIQQISEVSQFDWTQTYKVILEQLVCYLKNTTEQDEEVDEEKVCSIIEEVDLRRSKMKQIFNEIKKFILEYKEIIKNNSNHQRQIQADSNNNIQTNSQLINVKQSNEQSYDQEILVCNQINNEANERSQLGGKENCILLHIDSTQNLVDSFIQKICEISQRDWNKFNNPALKQLISYMQSTIELKEEIAENKILEIIQSAELSMSNQKEIINLIFSFVDQHKQQLAKDITIYLKNTSIEQQNDNDMPNLEFRNLLDNLDQQKRDICLKQINIINCYFEQNSKQLIACQNIIAEYPGQENFTKVLQEIQNVEGIQRLNIFEIYKNWLELVVDMNQYQKELILQLQQINFQKNGKLISEEYIQKFNQLNENEVENILGDLEVSYRQTKELLQIWKNLQDEINIENQEPKFLQFKQFVQNQIKGNKILTILDNKLAQNLVSLLQSSEVQDEKKLKSIYDQLNLDNQQIKLIQQEFENLYKTICKYEQNQYEEINQNTNTDQILKQNDLTLSEMFTLVYQQQDFCLEMASVKVICDFQKIQELVNQLKQKEIKTIGFYGDYKLSMQIIQKQYPKSQQLINLETYLHPIYDKLVAVTDGQTLFLILEEQKKAFEGDIFENEEGLLYARFLLDSCSIFVICLNSNQVSQWNNTNPFEQFEAFVPPKEYKNRSQLFLKKMTINQNLKKQNKIFLSNDQSNNIIMHEQCLSSIKNDKEILLNMNYKNSQITTSDEVHRLIDYISFDEQVDYVVFSNYNEKIKQKHRTSIYMLKKKINYNCNLELIFSIQGSLDTTIFINQYSKQWVMFANDTKKNSVGKINLDYTFEEGRIDTNVYYCKTQLGNTIERVDSCIILNEKNNVVYLYEEKKKQFYQLFLSGELKEIRFELQREISIEGIMQIQNITLEESGNILAVKNSSEGDFYVFQTEKYIYITNPNYIIKQQIELKQNFENFKLITTNDACFLLTSYQNNQIECFIIQEVEQQDDTSSMSNISDEKARIGNIVIDKVIKSMLHYGKNQTSIGCPGLVHQLFYFENNVEKIKNFEKSINKYFSDCLIYKNIKFNISHSFKNCFDSIDLLLNKVDSLLRVVDSIPIQDLQFILQTRIPIQLTTIQQSNYLPLKDGMFKQDLMNVQEVEDQIEQIKKQINFGWIENMVQLQNKEIYTVAMCGRQSVGKSSQLNRLFGTRFGVSASRCTDGIWAGLSKVEDKLILVLDCEGLFSIRRTDDEEVKLLLQITSISDITIVFCDIDGINQPFLSLLKKLQICAGKMQSDSFFLGTMVLLTKNISDEGDKNKIHQECQIHLNKKESKNILSKIFNKGVAYGFLKGFQAIDYDSNLQKVKDELLFKQILLKNKPKLPSFLMNILKYSMIQIYLNDDQDIDLISKQSEIKEVYEQFVDLFFDISKQNFINNDKLTYLFEYKPSSDEEKLFINDQTVLKFDYLFNQNQELKDKISYTDNSTNSENLKNDYKLGICENEENSKEQEQLEDNSLDDYKCYNIIQINQTYVKLIPQQPLHVMADKKSQNFEKLEKIFQGCFNILKRQNFNNYMDQMQKFLNTFVEQRRNIILEYFNNRMPKESKYRDIVHKFEQKINQILLSLDMSLKLCKQKCSKCDRVCVNIQEHKGDCNCETFHKCYSKCQICKSENECFLISGHNGAHYCKEINHLCLKDCKISNSCKQLCTLEPHSEDITHNCQGAHKCEFQCRLYDKCGKTCSLQNGHDEINHICDSTQCYDKCEFCDKLCGFSLHDHDILLSNIEKNKDRLMKDGNLVTKHLCGDSHDCLQKCQKPGVCSITYKAEEKVWETKTSRFEYQFVKPQKKQKQCSVKIEPWQISHEGEHHCESSQPHRCESQCPECLSYCFENYNHSGNHKSKNHRNKENCIFVSETDQIKINNELGNVRSYLPGESSTPENCLQSCLRMGRAHIHLRQCKGGDECAEKKYSFARHSKKKYKPFTHLDYDEMLCKGYWTSINWEPPAEDENLQIIQSCNTVCSHDSHKDSPNFCTKLAWHEGQHLIDYQKCEHLGSRIVDICFTIDTTSSMEWAMSKVSQSVNDILQIFEGKADIKYSVVSYRDHPPQDTTYVYKIDSQLTDYINIQKVLKNMNASGGGDTPEAVMDGLFYSTTKIQWRDKSQRFIFHICDSPPHGKQFGIKSSNPLWTQKGCPCGINEYQIAEQLKKQQIFYYLVKVKPVLNMMEEIFMGVFGSYFKQTIELQDTNKLNIEITQALNKEINITEEFYHVNDKK
ncbi:hypothetical protein ABPG74_019667 [Tetrahymena malaccensis]